MEGLRSDRIEIVRCMDAVLINRIMSHPKIYPHVSDDASPAPSDFDCTPALKVEGVYFLTPIDVGIVLGVFFIHKHSSVLYEVHTCLLPECWGMQALGAAKACAQWIFGNTTCRKLMTWVPANNRRAFSFALKAGMKEEGLNRKSFLKNGVLLDQHLLGMTKD